MANEETKIRPFSCGSEYRDWTERNCRRCEKSREIADACEIEYAVSIEAFGGDGYVSQSIADRMGYKDFELAFPCTEFVQVEPGKHWRDQNG